MKEYVAIYRDLGIPEVAIRCALGELRVPYLGVDQPAALYGFPPAFVPLWSDQDGPFYVGYWKHWLVSDRQLTIVRMTIEEKRTVRESARTFEQLVRVVAMETLCMLGQKSDLLEHFAAEAGFEEDLELIDEITMRTGSDPRGLLELDAFRSNAPLSCFPGGVGYSGDFPHAAMPVNERTIANTCGFEIAEDLRKRIQDLGLEPPWSDAKNQVATFRTLMAKRDYSGAWMSLNSPGWKFVEAKSALMSLTQEVEDENVRRLAEVWCSLDHEDLVAY
jgi:hypothetical protein